MRHGDLVYLAGQVADDTSLDAEGQTRDILAQIDHLLAETGSDKRHLLSVQIFLTDIKDIDAMNKAWDAWIDARCKPARATVEARLANAAWRVEITASRPAVRTRAARKERPRTGDGAYVAWSASARLALISL